MRRNGHLACALVAFSLALSCVTARAQQTGNAQVPAHDEQVGQAAAALATKDPVIAAKLPKEIADAGTLRLGAELEQPPEDFYAEDGRTPIGFEVDLARSLGNVLGITIAYQRMEFGALITALRSGRVDATMSAMNDTKPRQQLVSFVDYYNAGITMLVQKGNPDRINGPDDLCGKSVSARPGTTQQAFAEDQSRKCAAAGKPPVTVVNGTANAEVALHAGRFSAILDDTPTALYDAQIGGDGQWFEAVNFPPINGGPYGIGVPRDNAQLRDAIQAALQKLIDTGVYTKILSAWGMTAGAVQRATIDGAS